MPAQSGRADRGNEANRRVTFAVLAFAAVLMVLTGASSYRNWQSLREAQIEVAGYLTWVNAQVEVDFLKLIVATEKAGADTPDDPVAPVPDVAWQSVLRQFDIYYSRLDATLGRIRGLADNSPAWRESLSRIEALMQDAEIAAKDLDAARIPVRADLDRLALWIDGQGSAPRLYSVNALSVLAAEVGRERLRQLAIFRAHLALTVATMVVLTFIGLGVWILNRQLERRAAAERRLREGLARLIDAGPDAVIMTDPSFRIFRLNDAAERFFDCTGGEAMGGDAIALFFPMPARLAKGGKPHPLTAGPGGLPENRPFRDIVRGRTGRRFPVIVSAVTLMAGTADAQIALFIRDISESQSAMRALRRERGRAEAEAARNLRFLSVMSHEIRTPLHGVVAALDLLRARDIPPENGELVDIAANAAQEALKQADEVLEIGRVAHEMGSVAPAPFHPADLLRNVVGMVEPLARRSGIELRLEIAPEAEIAVIGMRGAFWHAVSNLLGNAIRFTREGGVTVRMVPTGTYAPQLRIEISDTGIGIERGLHATIFRDHYTTGTRGAASGKGAGLGLGVFRRAVEFMGGEYGLESQPGEGSTFWFTIPAHPARAPEPSDPGMEAPVQLSPDLRVLVVDDVEVNRILVARMLERLGVMAESAGSGKEAVARARNSAFDVILMDLAMPGMSGQEAAQEIRREGVSQRSRILALTANTFALTEIGDGHDVFDGILLKPLRTADLGRHLAAGGGWRNVVNRESPDREAAGVNAAGEAVPPGDRFTQGGLVGRGSGGEDMSIDDRIEESPRSGGPAGELAVPVLDDDVLKDLVANAALLQLGDLVAEMLHEAKLLAGLAEGLDPDELAVRFHRIAGVAAMLGATRLHGLAIAGEDAARIDARLPEPGFPAHWGAVIAATQAAYASVLPPDSGPPADY